MNIFQEIVLLLLSPRNIVWGDIVRTLLILGNRVKGQVIFGTLCIKSCGPDTDYNFCPITSNFTCTLFMMRGGTLLILGHGVKGQGQLWHSLYKTLWARYRLQFLCPRPERSAGAFSNWIVCPSVRLLVRLYVITSRLQSPIIKVWVMIQ